MKAARRISLIAALTVGLVAIGSSAKIFAATPDEKSPSEAAVKIDNFSFSPATITVPAGTTIRWTNRDDIPHNVVGDEKTFKSKVLDTDQEFTFTFSKPGTYSYFCSIHPHMTGKVVVQ